MQLISLFAGNVIVSHLIIRSSVIMFTFVSKSLNWIFSLVSIASCGRICFSIKKCVQILAHTIVCFNETLVFLFCFLQFTDRPDVFYVSSSGILGHQTSTHPVLGSYAIVTALGDRSRWIFVRKPRCLTPGFITFSRKDTKTDFITCLLFPKNNIILLIN